jgi:uncharacterized protein YukE
MAGGILSYPPEIVDAARTMLDAARQLDNEMAGLRTLVHGLVDASRGDAIQAFNEVQDLWNKSGLAHNETLVAVGNVAGESYQDITSFDTYLANQLR